MSEADDMAFMARTKAHIDLCNQQAAQAPGDQVAMSALYASARYCAWMCAASNADGVQMAGRRSDAMKIFADQFAQMFGDAYDDIAGNFPRK